MSDLVVLAFDDVTTADKARDNLNALEEGQVIGLEDMVVVIRDENSKVHIKQNRRHTGNRALGGGFWGMLIGLLFFVPGLGLVIGAAVGIASGFFHDFGIPDNFIKEVGESVKPNSSALFLMISHGDPGQVLARLKEFNGKVIQTSLSPEADEALRRQFPQS